MTDQPVFILPEGSQRTTGKNAQSLNIQAARQVADSIRSTLGPKGMDKMLVDSAGGITVTNDGVTILNEMEIENPAARMIIEIAKTQENEVGDGTTTAVVIAGEMLKEAETLLSQNIHPTVLAKGYRIAAEKSKEKIKELSKDITYEDTELLKKIAITAMTGKGTEYSKERLADLTVKAAQEVYENGLDKDNITLEKKVEGSVDDTRLIKGIVLDKERVHSSMPSEVKDARIALLDLSLEVRNTEMDSKIEITDPSQMQEYLDKEEGMLKEMVDKIRKSGANVVMCQKGIDDIAQHFLARQGIYAVRRVKRSSMVKLSKATGAKIISDLDDLSENDVGRAGSVKGKNVGEEEMTFVEECSDPKAVTMLIKGGTEHIVSEVKRALEDAIGDISSAINTRKFVPGAASAEMEVSRYLANYASSLSGREQLAVKSFANALEIIPRILAENAGLDPIDTLARLKSSHEKGNSSTGIDAFKGDIIDSTEYGIIEPEKIKSQAISSAVEVATMILRIDDVIMSGQENSHQMETNRNI
ncbi:MAG: thermosome subunit alpha [Nanobdellota archaeon]